LAEPAGNRILFTDAIYGELKDQILAHARVFLLPSALEGLPITLLEAMSYGRPCLVSDIPPHRDVITDGKNGFLHDEKNFEHLCERLREIDTSDAVLLSRVGESAIKVVAEGYDWEDIVDSTERFYESVLGAELQSGNV
jgi:glycosyltransferase involved in cell wall biosynthesis